MSAIRAILCQIDPTPINRELGNNTYNRDEKAEAAVLNLSCHYGLARHATLLTLRHIHQDAEIIFATQDEDARSCLKDSTDFNQTLLI